MVMIDTNVMTGHESITRTMCAGAREQAVRPLPSALKPLSPTPPEPIEPTGSVSSLEGGIGAVEKEKAIKECSAGY